MPTGRCCKCSAAPASPILPCWGHGTCRRNRQPDGGSSAERAQELIATALREGSSFFEWEHQRLNGKPFAAEVLLTRIEADGQFFLKGTVRDITARKQAEENILTLNQALEEKVRQLLDTQEELEQHRAHLEQEVVRRTATLTEAQRIAHLGNCEWDLVNNTLNWSDEVYSILGYAPQQIGASYEAFLNAVHPKDRQAVDDCVRDTLKRQHPYSLEHRILQPDGTLRYVHAQAEVKQADGGQPIRMVGTFHDITERKLAEAEIQTLQERLREQALRDPLTGLYNRRYLDEMINRELARAARNNQPVGIVMCDLDHFKLVNDTHGHLSGDEVLRVFAELLKQRARGGDIVCRFGGEQLYCVFRTSRLRLRINAPSNCVRNSRRSG